jgi:hypothetical protein
VTTAQPEAAGPPRADVRAYLAEMAAKEGAAPPSPPNDLPKKEYAIIEAAKSLRSRGVKSRPAEHTQSAPNRDENSGNEEPDASAAKQGSARQGTECRKRKQIDRLEVVQQEL